jgi:hypothetical protein
MPISMTTSDSTVAKTGRLMHRSEIFISQLPSAGGRRRTAAAPSPIARTGAPSRSLSWPAVTTTSPSARPSTTSTCAARRTPSLTLTSVALPSTTLNTAGWAPGTMACSGTISTSLRSPNSRRTRTNMPGRSLPAALSSRARAEMARPFCIDQRIDGIEHGLERLAGQRIGGHLHGLPLAQAAEIGFRQLEVDAQGADVLDIDQVLAFLDVVADADIAQADHAVERRPDRVLATLASASCTAASCTFSVAAELSSACWLRNFLAKQLLIALMAGLRQRQIGLAPAAIRPAGRQHRA